MIDVRTPAARNSDSETSHLAADFVTDSGTRGTNQRLAAAAVKRWPGKTSRELARLAGMDRHEMARRLPEIEVVKAAFRGRARTCEDSHRLALTWWPEAQ